ncbi:MAG: DNA mismatch repair endonuclease MutL [Gammaproteobacteria bacterium]|nr:DNA mismatch repair endonuclease MutL [Gammaproteobacteria bacterium]
MTIKILPPQLANQIAAGEVVERPASVVKELVENALDAGANQIEIEIEKGGHKRILIRDNGKGVDKAQLTLALSRHATSKISDIDDLEAIASLGFRGEALASISSVARLTMTSKPAEQNEAWSAIAEGLDMDVKVMPAAHPNGTSVEVLDLFFNTPARRKFLRAEKTEFSHIETLIKRIALSRPDVGFSLKHNGKTVKRFRAQKSDVKPLEQKSNRIADVINKGFIEHASVVSCVYDDIEISVWAKAPSLCVSVNPAQYSFVNGRMMRDKLIQHAIRQSYGQQLHKEQLPEYVIFIDLPATDVDVNVHPAKHEVRFHHARLLHDLLVKTIQDALHEFEKSQQSLSYSEQTEQSQTFNTQEPAISTGSAAPNNVSSGERNQSKPEWLVLSGEHSNKTALHPKATEDYKHALKPNTQETRQFAGITSKKYNQSDIAFRPAERIIDHEKLSNAINSIEANSPGGAPEQSASSSAQLLFLKAPNFVYFQFQDEIWLIDANHLFAKAFRQDKLNHGFSLTQDQQFAMTPLLVPVRLKLTSQEKEWCAKHGELLRENGFDTKVHQQFLIIKQVPNVLRNSDSGTRIPVVFNKLMLQPLDKQSLIDIILNVPESGYNKQDIQVKLTELAKQPEFEQLLEKHARKLNAQQLLEQ